MAITRKPKSPTPIDGVDVDALINKGGSVGTHGEIRAKKSKETPVIVRIPSDLLDRINVLVGARPLKTPRHTWLLEALLEKANREEQKP